MYNRPRGLFLWSEIPGSIWCKVKFDYWKNPFHDVEGGLKFESLISNQKGWQLLLLGDKIPHPQARIPPLHKWRGTILIPRQPSVSLHQTWWSIHQERAKACVCLRCCHFWQRPDPWYCKWSRSWLLVR